LKEGTGLVVMLTIYAMPLACRAGTKGVAAVAAVVAAAHQQMVPTAAVAASLTMMTNQAAPCLGSCNATEMMAFGSGPTLTVARGFFCF
jgi:hypothetical protein